MELKTKITAIQERQRTLSSQKHSTEQLISTVRTFMEMDTLTGPLVKALIDHIDIHETEGTGLNKKQKVDIYYRFAGYIELPEKENNCDHREDMRQGVAVEYIAQIA